MKEQMREASFQKLADSLPEGVNWGDSLTPTIAQSIWQAAVAAQEGEPAMKEQIDLIMEQVKEFASAWSLVGGRFDGGSMLENANNLKQDLRAALAALAALSAKQESWISVEDRLPEVEHEDYEFVLVAVDSAHTGKRMSLRLHI